MPSHGSCLLSPLEYPLCVLWPLCVLLCLLNATIDSKLDLIRALLGVQIKLEVLR